MSTPPTSPPLTTCPQAAGALLGISSGGELVEGGLVTFAQLAHAAWLGRSLQLGGEVQRRASSRTGFRAQLFTNQVRDHGGMGGWL